MTRQNKKALHDIITELKRLKSMETVNSSFCEGVIPSLERQLKKILKVYNYSYACTQGLADLKASLIVIETQLQTLKKQESEIDYELRA